MPATEWCQRYLPCYLFFSFRFRPHFFPCWSARLHSSVLWTGLPDIGHRALPKIWVSFLYGAYRLSEWFRIDSNGKMEIRHPVEESFGSEFRAICNHCSYGGLKSQVVEILWELSAFFLEKRPHAIKCAKFSSESFHRDTNRRCCVQISWNLDDGKWVKSCVIYPEKNKQDFASLSNCRYCADRAQYLPGLVPNNVLTLLQMSSKSVHFRRSYS